jgi:hypothetical protein
MSDSFLFHTRHKKKVVLKVVLKAMSNPTNWFSNLINNSRAAAASRNTNNNSDGSNAGNNGIDYPGQRQTQGSVQEAMGINQAMERVSKVYVWSMCM